MDDLIQDLGQQMIRVARLKRQYQQLSGIPGVNVRPAIYLMDAALDGAASALADGDEDGLRSAIEDLAGFDG